MTRPDHYTVRSLAKKILSRIGLYNFLADSKSSLKYRLWLIEGKIARLVKRHTKIYILRRDAPLVGLFSYFITMLGGIAYADRKGCIPVVDMQSTPNLYLRKEEIGRVNSWEYYFMQPGGISVEEALASADSVIVPEVIYPYPFHSYRFYSQRGGQLDYWRYICRKYIRLAPAVLERAERMKEKYSGRKVIGVLARGTDYVAMKPKGHPIPPTAEQAIAKAREAMQEQNFDAVYLATEDKNILAKFQEAFGAKLLLPEADYIDYDYDNGKYLASYIRTNNDRYKQALDYLVSMLFLSRCSGFIASMTSGSVGVMCLSEGFDYLYVFDLGVY